MPYDIFCILGARDAEMNLIERVLKNHKIPYTYAIDKNGNRVNVKNAYRAKVKEPVVSKQIWLIECDVDISNLWYETKVVIDHHNPRDFGYEMSHLEFLKASSIGQVLSLLVRQGYHPFKPKVRISKGEGIYRYKSGIWFLDGFSVPEKVLLIAASDHCLAFAYAGQCPGVSPAKLLKFRARRFERSSAIYTGTLHDLLREAQRYYRRKSNT